MKIFLKFYNHPVLAIDVHDTETGRLYYNLTKKQNEIQECFFRDSIIYNKEYMIELAKQASDAFGWNWFSEDYDLSITATLHKDLENYIGKLSFAQIPEKYDMLLYDLHHCLHAIQNTSNYTRSDNLQIEWMTDASLPLPKSFEFQEQCQLGDLILINPYVGHNPLQIYLENDFSNLQSTCKFHNVIKPGVVIANSVIATKDDILKMFKEKDPDFVRLHGEDKIKYYAGSAVIGRVENIKEFIKIKHSQKPLIFEYIEFND